MELRVLRYFLTVAQEENFTRAAEKLHVTQPTLSRQLRELELFYGATLFNRSARRVTLTEHGLLLRRRAEEILSLVDETEQELRATDEGLSGDIRIGAGESIHFGYLMQVAHRLQTQYPQIRFHVITGDGSAVLYDLDRGLIDFAFAYGAMDQEKYMTLALPPEHVDQWGVLVPQDSQLASKSEITRQDLRHAPLLISRQVLSSKTHGGPLQDWFGCSFDLLSIKGSFTMLYNGSLMVRAGMGYAIALDKIVEADTVGSGLCFRPLSPPVYAAPAIVWRKQTYLSKASQKFLEYLQQGSSLSAE